jgi:hypothetical protein|tara:strand:+ start:885 stop:1559 length:675 start_codon:yes stop_codon:yes gene_type:complete
LACHHSQAITHTALDLTKQEVKVHITEAQPNNPKPHLYGILVNQGRTEKVRVFPGPLQGTSDPNVKQLIQIPDDVLAKSGLCLKVLIWSVRDEESVHWSGAALPYEQQDPFDKTTLDGLISWQALQVAKTELRSPQDVVSDGKITASNQPDQITAFFQQGDNPGLLLTKSTARLQGKTDQGLMVILRVAAELKGVQVSDLINEVMWDAVRSGKLWACQPDNGMP